MLQYLPRAVFNIVASLLPAAEQMHLRTMCLAGLQSVRHCRDRAVRTLRDQALVEFCLHDFDGPYAVWWKPARVSISSVARVMLGHWRASVEHAWLLIERGDSLVAIDGRHGLGRFGIMRLHSTWLRMACLQRHFQGRIRMVGEVEGTCPQWYRRAVTELDRARGAATSTLEAWRRTHPGTRMTADMRYIRDHDL
jgi:hypothetical protein